MLRLIKLRLRALLPPALFLGLTFYFGWNAVHGRSGLEAQVGQRAALAAAQANFAAIDAQRQVWETRVAGLANASIDPDVLDGQARKILNLAEPGDYVVELDAPGPKTKR
jgi:cell division protein FtsB